MRSLLLAVAVVAMSGAPLLAQPGSEAPAGSCGEVVTIETHGRSTTRYALAHPKPTRRSR